MTIDSDQIRQGNNTYASCTGVLPCLQKWGEHWTTGGVKCPRGSWLWGQVSPQ